MDGLDSFRVLSKDLLGRVGAIRTKSGVFPTPHMFPVVDPNNQVFRQEFFNNIGVHAIMTNAYLFKRAQSQPEGRDIHKVLGFEETVATDSGAYQILEYGEVGVKPQEIVAFQEEINTDIGVILDVPTGFRSSPSRAKWTVDETVRRADQALRVRTRDDVLWVGPIQGGVYLKEVARSAREMGKRDFAIYALGSPTEIMESQRFEILVDMIVTAKKELPPSKPFHLFGAGHPSLFAFLVALGCDLFDSAAYALYGRTNRYLTPDGTVELENMEEFPCLCQACAKRTPREVLRLKQPQRERLLSEHNLQACFAELRRIREAIRQGRLWDLMELRAHAHPALKRCLNRMARYSETLERYTPVVKPRGIFYFGSDSERRPEIARHKLRVQEIHFHRFSVLVLLPGRWRRPYHEDPRYQSVAKRLRDREGIVCCFYSVPFGPVPLPLDETYPIAQTESLEPEDPILYKEKAKQVVGFVGKLSPRLVFFVCEGALGTAIRKEITSSIPKPQLVVFDGERFNAESFVEIIERKMNAQLGVHSV